MVFSENKGIIAWMDFGSKSKAIALVFSENKGIFAWMDFGSKSKAIAFGFIVKIKKYLDGWILSQK